MVVLLDAWCEVHDPSAIDVGIRWRGLRPLEEKPSTLALCDGENIAIDVEVWVTLQMIAALQRPKGKGREDKGVVKGRWAGPAARDGGEARDGMMEKELVRKATGKGNEDMRSTQNSFFGQAPTMWKHVTTWTKTQALLFFFSRVCAVCVCDRAVFVDVTGLIDLYPR